MENQEKKTVKDYLKEEMVKWQTKINEAKQQLHVEASVAREKLQPHINDLEKEMDEAKKQMKEFDDATEKAWKDINRGLDSSFKTMKRSFDKAKIHFQEPKTEETKAQKPKKEEPKAQKPKTQEPKK